MSMSVEMILRLIDRATGPLRGVDSELNRLKNTADKVNAAQAAGGKVRASEWLLAKKGAADAAKEAGAYRAALIGAGAATVGGAATAAAGFAGFGIKEAIAFEKAMADVRKKVNLDPGAEFRDVEATINRTAREIGISREQTASLTAEAGAAGIEYRDLAAFVRLAAKASSAWDVAPREAAERLAHIKAQTQATIPEMKDLADQVNFLGDNSAAKERDILDMLQRAGASAKAAGVPMSTTLAAMTALRSTGMQPEIAARFWNAFSSKLATIGEGGRGAKTAAAGLAELGLSVDEIQAKMRSDPTKAIVDLLDRLNRSSNKAGVGVKLFGQQWWDEFARAGQALPELIKQLDILYSGKWRGSLDRTQLIDLDTTSNHLERTRAMISEIGDGLMRWALPPINAQLDEMLAAFRRVNDGPDKPLIHSPSGNVFDAQARLEEARRQRPQGEALLNYETRLGLNKDFEERPAPIPRTPIFTQPVQPPTNALPGGQTLPTFAGIQGGNVARPVVDSTEIREAAAEAQRAGEEIKTALDVTATPRVDTGDLAKVAGEAQAAGGAFTSALNVTAAPKVDTSSIASALGMVRELSGALSGLGARAAAAGASVQRGVAAGSHALHDGPEAN